MQEIQWPYFDPDYENLSYKINPPRVVIDNDTDENLTLVKIDSSNSQGILVDAVQVLTDLDLDIVKAYISSDGEWLMDVFHVKDSFGKKVTDEKSIEFIQQSLGAKRNSVVVEVKTCLGRVVGGQSFAEHTVIELTGRDRPGLLSEISAVLANLKCNVEAAEAWTHNARAACVVYMTDECTSGPIDDQQRLNVIQEQLANLLRRNEDKKGVRLEFAAGLTHRERRLHQIMFADRDYEANEHIEKEISTSGNVSITIENCREKDYSVVNIACNDRPKLLFDIVCTLTDMQYVVFHASVHAEGVNAYQEYYIRHLDGRILDTESERQRMIKCLEAAIERRVSEGLRLEVCTTNRVGALSEITRVFRENGLTVTRADVYTNGEKATNVFYVSNASDGGAVDNKTVDTVRMKMGKTMLTVQTVTKNAKPCYPETENAVLTLKTFIKSHWEKLSMGWNLIMP